jgi:hypothetical protein
VEDPLLSAREGESESGTPVTRSYAGGDKGERGREEAVSLPLPMGGEHLVGDERERGELASEKSLRDAGLQSADNAACGARREASSCSRKTGTETTKRVRSRRGNG